MKRLIRTTLLALVVAAAACGPREKTFVILSTNDMHAKIQNFPRLAAAVEACRDTAGMVILVDAGDRWTGNAYVDKARTPGMPMIRLMNKLGYDLATLGNHEFDHGQAFLGRMIDSMDFEVVCANVVSDTCTFPDLPPYTIVERDGIRIGFIGVVTNYEGPGHPAGNAASFTGLGFPAPQQMAMEYAAELRPKVDVLVLVSHMGDNRDIELLGKQTQFDLVIGGHTHVEQDTLVNGTLLTQTGKHLANVGATAIKMRGNRIQSIEYRLIPLKDYAPDVEYQELVDADYADPEMNKPIGELKAVASKWGLANWMAHAVADQTDAGIGFYHVGGVRLDSIPAGGIGLARVYDLEPFGTQVAVMTMTPAEMRRMIVSKYNDPENLKEAHRIDLISTTPYTIVVDDKDNALDVQFPLLKEGRAYKIAVPDYVYKNYRDLSYTDGRITEEIISNLLIAELENDSPLTPDNKPRQEVRRK